MVKVEFNLCLYVSQLLDVTHAYPSNNESELLQFFSCEFCLLQSITLSEIIEQRFVEKIASIVYFMKIQLNIQIRGDIFYCDIFMQCKL